MTVKFHPRATLNLRSPNLQRMSTRTPADSDQAHQGLTWHWTADGGMLFLPDPIKRLQGIQRYHMDTLGYGDIAYCAAYDAGGNTYELRAPRYVQAHAASPGNVANRQTDGIVFLEDERGYTHEALEAFVWWHNVYGLAHRRFPKHFAHRWWGRQGAPAAPTQCPGDAQSGVIKFIGGKV